MGNRINYTLVGLFVVVLLSGLLSLAYWLEQNGGKQKYDHYRVYITESVDGLSPDASVKYRGVEVGTVEDMAINPENSEQVVLLLKIRQNTPIKVDVTATLNFFGITGLAFIELSGSSKDAKILKTEDGSIPVIPAVPSTFARFQNGLGLLADKSGRALDRFDRLLSDENLQNFGELLAQSKLLVQDLRTLSTSFRPLIENSNLMEKALSSTLEKVDSAALSVDSMASSLENNYANVALELNQNIQQSLELFNNLMHQLSSLTDALRTTIQTIDDSPSDLLFKHTEIKPGPGERGYNEKKK